MFSIKNNILYCIFVNVFVLIHGLVELPGVEDNDIIKTESAVRNTINSIFSCLKLKHVKDITRFREFAAIHNFFATITLQDHDNLKEIGRLAKVNNIDNKTQVFITQLNEVLNEDNKSYEGTGDVYVTTHIESFIKKLEFLKQKYGFSNNTGNFDINTGIINHIRPNKTALQNLTKQARNSEDENLLSDIEFWEPSSRRVFEGKRESIKRFPFMASVQFFKKFQCGGSIIKSDLVITSASCLQLAYNNRFFRENPAFLSVQVGCDLYEGGGENIPIQEVYFHPEYNPKNLNNNLAILRLQRVLKLGKRIMKVKKINFDRDAWALPYSTPGITIVGWGAKGAANVIKNRWSNRLSYAELDYYPLKECQEIYSKDYVTYKNFCAGFFSKGGGACNRDVGGPGVVRGILLGVVSFGSPNCGTPDAPTVFTKLGYYAEWIEEIMDQRVPIVLARTTERPSRVTYKFFGKSKVPTGINIKPVVELETLKAIPISQIDALRTVDENVLFKDFIETMFSSAEIKEYLDQYENESDETTTLKPVLTPSKIVRQKYVPTTERTTKREIAAYNDNDLEESKESKEVISYEVGSVKMVTSIGKFDRFEGSIEAKTIPPTPKHYTALDPLLVDDKMIEENIAKLINEIDINNLFEASKEASSDKKLTTVKTPKHTKHHKPQAPKVTKTLEGSKVSKPRKDAKTEKEIMIPLKNTVEEITEEESDDESDDTSSYDDDSEESLLALLGVANNNVEDKKEETDDAGLTIPFNDFTFRQLKSEDKNTINSNDIFNLLSQNNFMEILSEAVATVTQKRT